MTGSIAAPTSNESRVSVPKYRRNIDAFTSLINDERPLSPNTIAELAILLIQTFGLQHAAYLRDCFRENKPEIFDSVHRVVYEIQENVSNGVVSFTKHKFPETQAFIQSYISASCSEVRVFEYLKGSSYGVLPFPQKLLTYGVFEKDTFDAIDADRKRAFNLIGSLLRCEERIELTPEDELAVTSLYFNGGALIYDRRTVYFSQLIITWCVGAREKKDRLFSTMRLKDKIFQPTKSLKEFLKYKDAETFEAFLVLCSIDAVQKNLGLQFSDVLIWFLRKLFSDEEVRSDMCYFTADPPLLFHLDLSKSKANSAACLESIQLFFFLIQSQGVRIQYWSSLFLMLFHRSQWKASETNGFQDRAWIGEQAQENEAFATAFSGVQRLATAIAGRQVDFSNPVEADQRFLTDSNVIDILFFLWQHPKRNVFIENLEILSADPRFNLNFSTLYQFCQANRECILPRLTKMFVEKYFEVLDEFEKKGLEVKNAQALFIVPPIGAEVSSSHALRFVYAPVRAKSFMEENRERTINEEYFMDLREWILRPTI